MATVLTCTSCGAAAAPRALGRCASCGGRLSPQLDLRDPAVFARGRFERCATTSIWRWMPFLPVEDAASIVTLGEGGTPLVRSERLCRRFGIDELFVKNDTLLPTGSLKDRTTSVLVSKAKELGYDTVVTASTGNGACSLAAYAAAAGLRSVLLVPASTAPARMAQAAAYGGTVVAVDGDMGGAVRLYHEAVEGLGWFGCLDDNPYRAEGKKSYAYELYTQLGDRVPDWVLHPTASGGAVLGTARGFGDLRAVGWTDRAPKLVAAQCSAAAALVDALGDRAPAGEPPATSVAESLLVRRLTPLGPAVVDAIRASGGCGVAVDDAAILDAGAVLATEAGVLAEPSGAVALSALRVLVDAGRIVPGDVVVCNVTGNGLKQLVASSSAHTMRPIPPTLVALRAAI